MIDGNWFTTRFRDIEIEVRNLRNEIMELRKLCVQRLRVPPDADFEVEEDTTPEAEAGLVEKKKAPPVSRKGHWANCIGGYSCEASCPGGLGDYY